MDQDNIQPAIVMVAIVYMWRTTYYWQARTAKRNRMLTVIFWRYAAIVIKDFWHRFGLILVRRRSSQF